MATQKRKLTREELSAIRSAAGKKGAASLLKSKNFRGGRPKGSLNKNPSVAEPVRSVQMRESAYKIFVKLAGIAGETLVGFMSKVAEALKAKNAKHFTNEPPVQM